MKRWIQLPRSEGVTSRQAHCDLPEGTYEREMGREGFFGPATQFIHTHPPTGWTAWEGPLRPRAFDLNRLADGIVVRMARADEKLDLLGGKAGGLGLDDHQLGRKLGEDVEAGDKHAVGAEGEGQEADAIL